MSTAVLVSFVGVDCFAQQDSFSCIEIHFKTVSSYLPANSSLPLIYFHLSHLYFLLFVNVVDGWYSISLLP